MIVLKFKSIAEYQVTHLLENNNIKNESNSNIEKETTNTNKDTVVVNNQDKNQYIEKLDVFLNSFEDKDRVKVT